MDKRFYCPFCGKVEFETNTVCIYCGQHTPMVEAKHNFGYYVEKSMELYGDYGHYEDVFFEEDVSKSPLYDEKYRKIADERQKEIVKKGNERYNAENKNTPECPTCQSTNIKKISATKRATHGYLFGIFSKTAFSQFECKNCGYKW